ncbi:ABC transporter substrate-binding protein [Streptomonospora wellingtoniae]|uniref:Sugar ABC transporter substrate-binding protein n=1 Tax=Streptomonospora wellingtoniae TaxID=3075544 RepID=A0ABU2KN93_9ACTN|nr:sugar ABC transporter substrate-binding protein [Streptomonospora sp. DSM 45055]MDT0300708.1 sugar ABC transporter substrate-binding protein [Streptomonospora sp. DSM 45055]
MVVKIPAKAVLSASTALGLVAALTACGSGEESGDQTLTYWASNQGASVEEDKKVLKPALDRFTEKTGVEVELEVIPWSELYNRILTAVSSGDAPDVLNIGNTWAASLQETGAFVPYEGADLEAVGGKGRFVETSFATGGAEGEAPTSVPLYGLSYALFYNPTMFEEAGIEEPPATWEEFVDTAKKLTKDTDGDGKPDQYGLAMEAGSERQNSHFAHILGQQYGGQLWKDGPNFSSGEQVEAVKMWVDMMAEEEIVDPSNAEFSDGTQSIGDFVDGNAAMIMMQGSARTTMAARDFDNYEVAQVPMLDPLPGEPIQSHAAGINISVFNDTENKEGALQLVKHLTSPEEQVYLSQEFQTLPVATKAYDSEELQSESMDTFRTILTEHASPMPLIPEEGQMETVLGESIAGLFADAATGSKVTEADVRKAMKEAETQMDAAN